MKSNVLKMVALAALTMAAQVTEASAVKSERVLVVVSELQQHGPQNLRGLYTVLEEITKIKSDLILGDDYRQVIHLRRDQATLSRFRDTLRSLAGRADTQAIDVIMSLHGGDGKLYFREGRVSVEDMVANATRATTPAETELVRKMKAKLRMIYNLSCFGRSHNLAFRNMGFDVSVGSNGINANAEFEFPIVLTAWSLGSTFGGAFDATNNDGALAAADGPVRFSGINADSRKFFRGTTSLKIDSDPL